jgi:hypothetical protein
MPKYAVRYTELVNHIWYDVYEAESQEAAEKMLMTDIEVYGWESNSETVNTFFETEEVTE